MESLYSNTKKDKEVKSEKYCQVISFGWLKLDHQKRLDIVLNQL